MNPNKGTTTPGMKRYLPIAMAILIIFGVGLMVISQKNKTMSEVAKEENSIGSFTKQQICARSPQFLQPLKIPQPVVIDLSQKRFKGIAFHYGRKFEKTLHPKIWEQYEHFSTYVIDENGNILLIPTPFISILPTTFNLQKNLYKLDTKTGKLSIFMHFDDIHPSSNNPYGLNAIAYDCDDKTLWAAAIDESNYESQKGVIYHINLQTKEILQKVEGFDVLSMTIARSEKGKYLLVGSARDNGLYAYDMSQKKNKFNSIKLFELPLSNERIRKIKVIGHNLLEIQSVPFSYSLIAQSSKKDRIIYTSKWDEVEKVWIVIKK